MGCGCGDLIEAIQCVCRNKQCILEWEGCGCGNLMQVNRRPLPAIECHGIDINPDNIEAAAEKNISGIYLGDCDTVAAILPRDLHFDLMVFCGLLNRQVTTREKARQILANALQQLKTGGHIIVTGYTSCHLTAEDFSGMGLEVLRKSIPSNIFRNYQSYYLRQLYVARKM